MAVACRRGGCLQDRRRIGASAAAVAAASVDGCAAVAVAVGVAPVAAVAAASAASQSGTGDGRARRPLSPQQSSWTLQTRHRGVAGKTQWTEARPGPLGFRPSPRMNRRKTVSGSSGHQSCQSNLGDIIQHPICFSYTCDNDHDVGTS